MYHIFRDTEGHLKLNYSCLHFKKKNYSCLKLLLEAIPFLTGGCQMHQQLQEFGHHKM